MKTVEQSSWEMGPLKLMKRVIEDPQARSADKVTITAVETEWSLNMGNVVWIIPEDTATKILEGVYQKTDRTLSVVRLQAEIDFWKDIAVELYCVVSRECNKEGNVKGIIERAKDALNKAGMLED